MSRKLTIQALTLGVLVLFFTQCSKPYNLAISNRYVNFHIRVDVANEDGVNDFHLILGGVDTFDLKLDYFAAAPGYTDPVEPEPEREIFVKVPLENSSLMVWEFNPPLHLNSWWHFGLSHALTAQRVEPIIAYWTYHGPESNPVAILPFPLQVWETSADTIIATVWNPVTPLDKLHPLLGLSAAKDTRGTIVVKRSWVYAKRGFPLFELMWDNEQFNDLEWHEVEGDPVTVEKDGKVELRLTDYKPDDYNVVIMKYSVTRPGADEPLYYFVDQVEILKLERPKD